MKRRVIRPLSVIAACVMAFSAQAATTLNGVANFVELKRSIYLAGLYLEAPSQSAEDVMRSDQDKEMVIKVTAKKWSPRRFGRQWNKGLLINNGEEQLEQYSEQVIEFNNLLKDNLVQGDELRIKRIAKGGAVIEVNGEALLNIKEAGFFEFLLNAWLGNKPPSSGFKADLLKGEADAELLALYNELQPSAQRIAEVKKWNAEEQEPAKVVAKAPAKKAAKVEKAAAPKAQPKVAAKPQPKAEPKPVVKAVAKPAPKVEPKPVPKAEPKPTVVAKVEAKPEPKPAPKVVAKPVAKPAPVAAKPAADLSSKLAALSSADAASDDELEEAEAALDKEEQQGLQKLYQSMVVKKVKRGAASYYANSLRRVIKKSDAVLVTLNRNGEVTNVQPSKGPLEGELADMALRTLNQKGPFPAMPAGLDGDNVTVSVPGKYILK
jgi:outer membrane biosynthesis protein TonB